MYVIASQLCVNVKSTGSTATAETRILVKLHIHTAWMSEPIIL